MATGMGMATDTDMKTDFPIGHALSGLLLLCLGATSSAQQNNLGGDNEILSAPAADDVPASQERAWTIEPRVRLTETLTDNVNINRTANGKKSDLVTELAPGIRIEARTARLKAYLDYSLLGQFYAQTDYSRTQNALNAFGTFEAVDNWLFFDFSGVIAQQAISAFGAQSPDSSTINNNSTETATYRFSPFIRGQMGGWVDYSLRYNLSTTNASAANANDVDLEQWTGQLRGSTPFHSLKWTIDGNQQTTEYSRGRETEADMLRGSVNYSITPQFRINLSAGRESNNYLSVDRESNSTHGYGFDWNPTERTQISAFKEKRFFGDGHNVRFTHRFPRSSVSYTDTRDVMVLPNQFSTIGLGNIYDLYFDQFASLIPDPIARASFVRTLLELSGINPNTQVTSGFLASRATIQRRQQLAFAIFGIRNSITLSANRTESESLLASNTLIDDFSQNDLIRQKGVSLNFSHRLSELSNLNVLAARQETTGHGSNTRKTTSTLYQVNVSTKLSAKTTASLSARRSEFDSPTNPYTENALIGTLSFIY